MPLSALPIDEVLPELLDRLRAGPSAVLVAPPGAGKTTRVPPAVLRAGLLSPEHPTVLVLQPRRVAARATAARIADENRWTIGREVGWHIRNDNRTSSQTRLRILTEGILTRRLQSDPTLDGVGAVLLDEFHERSLHADLALARLREIQSTVRPDLRLVVMSATLAAEPVSAYLGGCPIVRSAGRTFPVAVSHILREDGRTAVERAPEAVREALTGSPDWPAESPGSPTVGDVLVFLPGMAEIRRVASDIAAAAERANAVIRPLHSVLDADEQDAALRPDSAGRRKLILSTNIAETSLTIEGVRTVIDTGVARGLRHDPLRGLDRLELDRISRASAEQRAGRAGRVGPGVCRRLWTAADHRQRPEHDAPEIARVDLSALRLLLYEWGFSDASRFDWFEPPPPEMLAGAERLLTALGAVVGGRITELGRRLLERPLHPRLARLLAAAEDWNCRRAGAELAALLSERDILTAAGSGRAARSSSGPGGGGPRAPVAAGFSDVVLRLDALRQARAEGFRFGLEAVGIDPVAARAVGQLADELDRAPSSAPAGGGIGGRRGGTEPDDDALGKLVLLAYPDRLCRRRAEGADRAVMVGGRGVLLDPASVVQTAPLFVALDPTEFTRDGRTEFRVRQASWVREEWLTELLGGALSRSVEAEFDSDRQCVVGVARTRFLDLVLREDRSAAIDPDRAGEILAREAAGDLDRLLAEHETASRFLARVRWLIGVMPELELPSFSGAETAELLVPACRGRRSLDELARLPWAELLRDRLDHRQQAALARCAPETLTVPTGNRLQLRYEPGRPPVLAVRLQELFGLAESPRVADGRAVVVLELLAPNYRPVQVTSDLRSFWNGTYQTVRKELRARYPKHSWPEDPWTAPPVAKGRATKR